MKNSHNPFWRAQLLLAVFSTIGASFSALAQEKTTRSNVFPRIEMTDAPLDQAIGLLAKQSELNYIIDPSLSFERAPLVNFRWTNITARAALDRLLKEHDLDLVESPATTVSRIAPHKLHVKPVDPALVGGDTNIVAHYPPGSDTNEALTPLIMMTDAPLEQAVMLLAKQGHLKIAFDGELLGGHIISFRWQKLTVRQALVALLDCYDFTLIEDPSTHEFRIKAKPH